MPWCAHFISPLNRKQAVHIQFWSVYIVKITFGLQSIIIGIIFVTDAKTQEPAESVTVTMSLYICLHSSHRGDIWYTISFVLLFDIILFVKSK